jgi:hypothetical protein
VAKAEGVDVAALGRAEHHFKGGAYRFSGQQAQTVVGVAVLNRMLNAGRPDSVRRLNITA